MTEEEIGNQAQSKMDNAYEKALAKKEVALADDQAIAWIMYNSSDWSMMYSAGDIYDPNAKTNGMITTDVPITGAGSYTVALDFTKTSTGYAKGTAFLALGIGNGEILYPGYVVDITEILVNGKAFEITGKPYTSSDDMKCTRVNLYNKWVTEIPADARTLDGNVSDATTILLENEKLGDIETISITFDYNMGSYCKN